MRSGVSVGAAIVSVGGGSQLRQRLGALSLVYDEVYRHLSLEAADVAVAEVVAQLVDL